MAEQVHSVREDEANRQRSRYTPLQEYVWKKVEVLQAKYTADACGSAAPLARLRRAISSAPGSDPLVWQETMEGLPVQFVGRDDEPSREEHAVHAAITLFAMHQQSQSTFRAHKRGQVFGHAASQLGRAIGEPPVLRRFQALATATSFEETLTHARGLISQFRSQKISLDYGRFAVDLAKLQDPRSADRVRLDWGRTYYFAPKTETVGTDAAQSSGDAESNGEEQ